jgi:pyruvate/2-oxoglutarate dehydrogenase complex dihydrolipoamide dehydrogenase (E3) component
VVEKAPKFGGTSGLRGCIPTKALLHTAAVMDEIRDADALGITVAEPVLDIVKAQDRLAESPGRQLPEELLKQTKRPPQA